ncbi:protoheme IX farnesyltransferase, partial [Magnaporthiopsis poae ATCC 64411]
MPGPRSLLPGVGVIDNVCWRCCRRRLPAGQRFLAPLSTTARPRSAAGGAAPSATAQSPRVKGAYFLSNTLLDRFGGIQFGTTARNLGAGAVTSRPPAKPTSSSTFSPPLQSPGSDEPPSTAADPTHDVLPHRRRQAARRAANLSIPATHGPDRPSATLDKPLPPDASSILAEAAAKQPADSLRRKLSALLSLSKPRLTFLVVLTAMAPYALYPVPAFLSPGAAEASLP